MATCSRPLSQSSAREYRQRGDEDERARSAKAKSKPLGSTPLQRAFPLIEERAGAREGNAEAHPTQATPRTGDQRKTAIPRKAAMPRASSVRNRASHHVVLVREARAMRVVHQRSKARASDARRPSQGVSSVTASDVTLGERPDSVAPRMVTSRRTDVVSLRRADQIGSDECRAGLRLLPAHPIKARLLEGRNERQLSARRYRALRLSRPTGEHPLGPSRNPGASRFASLDRPEGALGAVDASQLDDVSYEEHEGRLQWPIALTNVETNHVSRGSPGQKSISDECRRRRPHETASRTSNAESACLRDVNAFEGQESQPRIARFPRTSVEASQRAYSRRLRGNDPPEDPR